LIQDPNGHGKPDKENPTFSMHCTMFVNLSPGWTFDLIPLTCSLKQESCESKGSQKKF
jgi:hypothetical protein